MTCPTPHGDKLRALVGNDKLPASDRPGVDAAIVRYEAWTAEIEAIEGTGVKLVEPLVASLEQHFSTVAGRIENRDVFKRYLADHPFSPQPFLRFLRHVERLLDDGSENEGGVLERGWF